MRLKNRFGSYRHTEKLRIIYESTLKRSQLSANTRNKTDQATEIVTAFPPDPGMPSASVLDTRQDGRVSASIKRDCTVASGLGFLDLKLIAR